MSGSKDDCMTCEYQMSVNVGTVHEESECHRYPPQLISAHERYWPVVIEGCWCGEYRLKEKSVLAQQIDFSMFTTRCENMCKSNNIVTYGDLCKKTVHSLMRTKNCGIKTIAELSDHLSSLGLKFSE